MRNRKTTCSAACHINHTSREEQYEEDKYYYVTVSHSVLLFFDLDGVILYRDFKRCSRGESVGEEEIDDRVFEVCLEGTFERTCAVLVVVATLGKECSDIVRESDIQSLRFTTFDEH